MSVWLVLVVAVALGLERVCYAWIARSPDGFRAACTGHPLVWVGEPVTIVGVLFGFFKIVQISVFAGWCYALGDGVLTDSGLDSLRLGLGGGLIVIGQALNASVFYRLGAIGVFYGDRLGHVVRWSQAFPFSVLAHPQYLGAVLTIWGIFVVLRFPHGDWIVLPVLETVYYAVGARVEALGPRGVPPTGATLASREHADRFERLLRSF